MLRPPPRPGRASGAHRPPAGFLVDVLLHPRKRQLHFLQINPTSPGNALMPAHAPPPLPHPHRSVSRACPSPRASRASSASASPPSPTPASTSPRARSRRSWTSSTTARSARSCSSRSSRGCSRARCLRRTSLTCRPRRISPRCETRWTLSIGFLPLSAVCSRRRLSVRRRSARRGVIPQRDSHSDVCTPCARLSPCVLCLPAVRRRWEQRLAHRQRPRPGDRRPHGGVPVQRRAHARVRERRGVPDDHQDTKLHDLRLVRKCALLFSLFSCSTFSVRGPHAGFVQTRMGGG